MTNGFSFTVKTHGLKEVKAALRALPDSTAKSIMRRTMKEISKPLVQTAKSLAPYDDGQLRDSIKVSSKLSRRQKRLFRKRSQHDVNMFVGAGPVPHAHLIEYGTSNMNPQPFMRPAWDKHKRPMFYKIRGHMWYEIKKTLARRAKKNKAK